MSTNKKIYEKCGLINVVRDMIYENMSQLSLPIQNRKYLCIRITNAITSHTSTIIQAPKEEGIKVKDLVCFQLKAPTPSFTLGSNYTGLTKIGKRDKYIVVYIENNTADHTSFDVMMHTSFRDCQSEKSDKFLGTVVLFLGQDFTYKCNAPEQVYDKVVEYDFVDEDEPDAFVE